MYFVLTGGEHETVAFPELVGVEKSNDSEGAPKHRSRYLGDKAYSSQDIRQQVRRTGTTLSFHGVTRSGRDDSTGDCIGA